MWTLQALRFVTLCVLLIGCEKQYRHEVAQARNTAPVLARNCVTCGNSSLGNGNCTYSSAIGPVKFPLMIAIWQGDRDALQNLTKTVASLNILIPLDCYDGTKKLYTTPINPGYPSCRGLALPLSESRDARISDQPWSGPQFPAS